MTAFGDPGPKGGRVLASLPELLSLAREMVVATFPPGDHEIDALRALLEECVVSAHRLHLRGHFQTLNDLGTARGKP